MTRPRKRCPHCESTEFSEMRDACLRVSVDDSGQKFSTGVLDYGSSLYMMVCLGCDTHVETSDLRDPA